MKAFSSSDDGTIKRRRTCPLHKQIRNQHWSIVMSQIQHDPSLITYLNGVGWSSLTLAIYHSAPIGIISEMVALSLPHDRQKLLSTCIPNGSRLCLHFATRYSSSLEVIKLLTEPYPRALLAKSTDGATPLDRAIYYRKDNCILSWLEAETQKERAAYEKEVYNEKLQQEILKCCEACFYAVNYRLLGRSLKERSGNDGSDFVLRIYTYTKEREMIGLFHEVLSYVGVHKLP